MSQELLILSRADVLELLSLRDCIDAVERAFRLHAEGRTLAPGVLGVPASGGGFHIKAAGLLGDRSYFAAKTNANFPDNPRRFGRPTIQGTIMLADAANGTPLAIMESGSVTALRTGAATAVAAKYLARGDARTATIVGCGVQGELQLAAIATSSRSIAFVSSISTTPVPKPWPVAPRPGTGFAPRRPVTCPGRFRRAMCA
jgi:alanine dehydrogenase